MASNTKEEVIHLSTEGGWQYDALLNDDPLFGEYIESLREVGEVPTSIVFSDSVADILEEEWPYIDLFRSYMETAITEGRDLNVQLSQLAPVSSAWTHGDDFTAWHLPGVSLSDISRVSRIITIPDVWHLHLMIGNVNEKEAISHVLIAAREMERVYGTRFYLSNNDMWTHSIILQLHLAMDADLDEEDSDLINTIVMVVVRDAAMDMINNAMSGTLLTNMNWDLLRKSLEAAGVTKGVVYNLVLSYAGRGNPSFYSTTSLPFSVDEDERGVVSIVGVEEDVMSTYNAVLTTLPLSTLFPFLTRDAIVRVPYRVTDIDDEMVVNSTLKVLPWVHDVVIYQLIDYLSYSSDPVLPDGVTDLIPSIYPDYFYLLDHFIVGRDNLVRISHMPHDASQRQRTFIQALRRYLEVVPVPDRVVSRFPRSVDIIKARTNTKKYKL